jgi:hypothetical protein
MKWRLSGRKLVDREFTKMTEKIFKDLLKVTLFGLLLSTLVFGQTKSLYTEISDGYCQSQDKGLGNGVFFRAECKGIGGYRVIYWEGEDRHQEMNLISPTGKILGPELMKVSMIPYSEVDAKLEWRVSVKNKKIIPTALIVKYKTLAVADIPEKPYLVVVKIKDETACITDIIKATEKNAAAKARQLADKAASKPCYQKEEL